MRIIAIKIVARKISFQKIGFQKIEITYATKNYTEKVQNKNMGIKIRQENYAKLACRDYAKLAREN